MICVYAKLIDDNTEPRTCVCGVNRSNTSRHIVCTSLLYSKRLKSITHSRAWSRWSLAHVHDIDVAKMNTIYMTDLNIYFIKLDDT